MELLAFLCLVAALLVFLWKAFATRQPKYDLLAIGLALATLALILQGVDGIEVNADVNE